MASKNIDQLAAASAFSDTDKLVVAQGDAVLKRGTLAQVRAMLDEGFVTLRAARDGIGDATAALQAAVDAAQTLNVPLKVPAGTYRLTARINTSSTKGLVIIGASSTNTIFLWDAGSTNGGGLSITYSDWLFPAMVFGLSFYTRANGAGTALLVIGPNSATSITMGPLIKDIVVTGENYNTQGWLNGIEVRDAWYVSLEDISVHGKNGVAPPFQMEKAIWLNDVNVAYMRSAAVFHAVDAVHHSGSGSTGGEALHLSHFEFVGVEVGVNCVSATVNAATKITDGHINSYKRGIKFIGRCQSAISNILFYKTNLSTDAYIGIELTGGANNKFHNNSFLAPGAPTGDTYGIVLSGALTQFNHIHNNDFSDFYGTTKVGVLLGSSVANNYIRHNSADSSVSPVILVAGDVGASNVLEGNLPTAIQNFAANAATPNVGNTLSGHWNTANSSTTTITNFLNGYTGQMFTMLVNDSNTTVQNNANIYLRNGANYTPPIGTIMVFRRDATIWREVSRS